MTAKAVANLPSLYEGDETAWLEAMAELVRERRYEDMDYVHLAEYLEDMARRDRREVRSRLAALIAHLLKWQFQPDKRTGSWRATIVVQLQELGDLVAGGVLRAHAEAVLTDAFKKGVQQAMAETSLPREAFPDTCPYSLDELLAAAMLDA